jgi:parallel beta-helix repeat protein
MKDIKHGSRVHRPILAAVRWRKQTKNLTYMKTNRLLLVASAVFLSTLNPQLSTCCAQGSLTPPGAPAPTMKTLDQVEARTIVNATNTPGDADNLFVISTPGSYYLTGNITGVSGKNGILITADNVTLDLNGFALIGVAGAKIGIFVGAVRNGFSQNAFVRNGSVQNWPENGLCGSFRAANGQYEHLRFSQNGVGILVSQGNVLTEVSADTNASIGIQVDSGCTLTKCSARNNTGDGIMTNRSSTIIGCTSYGNAGHGINTDTDSTIKDSTAGLNGQYGIQTGVRCSIVNCTANGNGNGGIVASAHCLVKNCVASSNNGFGFGIVVSGDSYVLENQCSNNTGDGIVSAGTINRIEGNHTNYNGGKGINADADWVVRNTSSNNPGGNFSPATGADIGPIQAASTATSPFANLK